MTSSFSAEASALEFYLDNGVDVAIDGKPVNRLKPVDPFKTPEKPAPTKQTPVQTETLNTQTQPSLMGTNEARDEAITLAKNANDLDALKDAIATFDGLSLKKMATNLVFSDGNPNAKIMLIGEAPGADEDRQGQPFVGISGQLLDKILACIGLSRHEDDPAKSVYISNILNWRPPGNRTPSPAEIEISLPFIERHIQLIKPEFLILCGGVSAKSLLASTNSISRLRKSFHDYKTLTPELAQDMQNPASTIQAMATYHPAYLLRTPIQKKAVWQDMLMLQSKIEIDE